MMAAIQNAKRIAFQGEPGAGSDGQPERSAGVRPRDQKKRRFL